MFYARNDRNNDLVYGVVIMRPFKSFLFVLVAAILILFPVTQGAYDFKTDVREDTKYIETAAGVTTGNITLVKSVYDDDTSTITITSDLYTDTPVFTSYNSTSRLVTFSGLTASEDRTITVSYDTDALTDAPAIAEFINILPFLWWAFIIMLIGAGVGYIVFRNY